MIFWVLKRNRIAPYKFHFQGVKTVCIFFESLCSHDYWFPRGSSFLLTFPTSSGHSVLGIFSFSFHLNNFCLKMDALDIFCYSFRSCREIRNHRRNNQLKENWCKHWKLVMIPRRNFGGNSVQIERFRLPSPAQLLPCIFILRNRKPFKTAVDLLQMYKCKHINWLLASCGLCFSVS